MPRPKSYPRPASVPADAAMVLDSAARLINGRGLARHTFHDKEGRLDVLGAIRMAIHGNPDDAPLSTTDRELYAAAKSRLRDWLSAQRHTATDGLRSAEMVWSDGHSQAEVVAGLRAAAQGEG